MATAATAADIQAPSAMLALTELPRALLELGSLAWAAPLLATAPRGDGHPVLILPGFMATDSSTGVLRRYLDRLGYDVHAWELGRNLGPRAIGREGEKLVERLRAVHALTGQKVSLVGWSLGGVMARLLPGRASDAVRQVITLGSPFAGSPKATNVWRAYEFMTGQKIDHQHTRGQMAEAAAPPPVPTTAIFTREDGVVAWQNCLEPEARKAKTSAFTAAIAGSGSIRRCCMRWPTDWLRIPATGTRSSATASRDWCIRRWAEPDGQRGRGCRDPVSLIACRRCAVARWRCGQAA